jgi:peptidyl-prolyl cis-trans isomerase SurA
MSEKRMSANRYINPTGCRPNTGWRLYALVFRKVRFIKTMIYLGACWVAVILQPTTQPSAADVVDRIVAIVNNEVISLYELNQILEPFIEKINASQYPLETEQQLIARVRQKVINQMIDQKLTDQELAKHKITVSPEEVDNFIERIKESNSITDEQFLASLSREGYTLEEYRQEVEKQIQRVKLINREVKAKIVITKEDIESYYRSHREDYAGEKKFHLRNIYARFQPYADNYQRRAAVNLMNEVHQRLQQGDAIDDVLRAYATSSPPIEGADLGLFKLEELSDQLRQLIENMQSGQFTPVVEMPYGYQIVYVEKIVDIGGKSLDEVASEIEDKLYNEIIDQKYASWLEALRERSHIKIIN